MSAHPGHELRLYHWMERTHPDVFLLTDGSGCNGLSRLESSRKLIETAGARLLGGSGTFSDREIYQAICACDAAFFLRLAQRINDILDSGGYTTVVCDALEGFNTSHDWCHYLALVTACRRGLSVYDFPLESAPQAWISSSSLTFQLDAKALERKLAAAADYTELAAEVARAIETHGTDAFALEVIRVVPTKDKAPPPPSYPPFYETFGEKRVKEKIYDEVIRWQKHMKPLIEKVWEAVCES